MQIHLMAGITCSRKIKSAATEAAAQKTQTPIVAKLTQCELDAKHTQTMMESAFLSNSHYLSKQK
jgi:hypothetical protein